MDLIKNIGFVPFAALSCRRFVVSPFCHSPFCRVAVLSCRRFVISPFCTHSENLNAEQVANQFFRILKRTNASESIRTVGFNTKKFNKSESNRVIYAKELLAIYENLRFFNEYIRQNKTIVITDNLPAKYLIQSGKTKDVFVYSTISKLVQEFPKVEISYAPGAKNLADLFSRPIENDDEILKFETNHLPHLIGRNHYFFKNIDDWLKCKDIEKLTEEMENVKKVREEGIDSKSIDKENLKLITMNKKIESQSKDIMQIESGK